MRRTDVWGSHSSGGSVFNTPRICSRGHLYSDLTYAIGDDPETPYSEDYERSNGSASEIQFLSDRVVIPNIIRTMEVLGEDIFSSFEIIVWLPEDGTNEYDSIITSQKTLWRGKITLMNGSVTVEGDFPTQVHTMTTGDEGQDIVQIIGWNLEVMHSENVTPETTIEVVFRGDGGVDDSEMLENVIEATEENEEIEFSLYPVPTNANLTINYTNELAGSTIVAIYNSMGVHLVDVHSGYLELDEHVFYQSMSGLGLTQGEIYYVFITVGGNVYIKQGIMN